MMKRKRLQFFSTLTLAFALVCTATGSVRGRIFAARVLYRLGRFMSPVYRSRNGEDQAGFGRNLADDHDPGHGRRLYLRPVRTENSLGHGKQFAHDGSGVRGHFVRTLSISTHDADFSLRCVDRVVVLDKGELLCQGNVDEVFSREEIFEKARRNKPILMRVREKLSKYFPVAHELPPRSLEALDLLLERNAP